MVSKASDDLPDPETPETTVSLPCGISQSTPFRLWVRAPRITMESFTGILSVVAFRSSGCTLQYRACRERAHGASCERRSGWSPPFRATWISVFLLAVDELGGQF